MEDSTSDTSLETEAFLTIAKSINDKNQAIAEIWGLMSNVFGDVEEKTKFCLGLYLFSMHNIAFQSKYSSRQKITDIKSVQRVLRLMKFATAAYGWKCAVFFDLTSSRISTFQKGIFNANDSSLDSLCHHCEIPKSSVLRTCWESSNIFFPGYYLIVDHGLKSLVFAIRGTLGINDVITDLLGASAPFQTGKAHDGIARAATQVLDSIFDLLKMTLDMFPGYVVEIVGHSLGAGTAALISILLKNKCPTFPLRCYCFGPPPVICKDLVSQTTEYITSYVLGNDIVPRLCVGTVVDLKHVILKILKECDSTLLKLLKTAAFGTNVNSEELKKLERQILEKTGNMFTMSNRLSTSSVEHQHLYLPGEIYHLVDNGSTYGMYNSKIDWFDDLILNSTMFIDHLPNSYEKALLCTLQQLTKDMLAKKSFGITQDEKVFFHANRSHSWFKWCTQLLQCTEQNLKRVVTFFLAKNYYEAMTELKNYFTNGGQAVEAHLLDGVLKVFLKKNAKAIKSFDIALTKFDVISRDSSMNHNLVVTTFLKPSLCLYCRGLLYPFQQCLACTRCSTTLHATGCADNFQVLCRSHFTCNPLHVFVPSTFHYPIYCTSCNARMVHQDGLYCIHCHIGVHVNCKDALHKICNGISIPWEEIYVERGIAYYFEGKYEKAIEDFSRGIECCMVEEQQVNYMVYRGMAYYHLAEFKECYRDLKVALKDGCKYFDCLGSIVKWLEELGYKEDATFI